MLFRPDPFSPSPVTGNAQYAGYHFQQGNYGRAIFYEAMMVGDMVMVGTVLQASGKFALRGAERVLTTIAMLNLPYRQPVTIWVSFTRFFVTRTGYEQVIKHHGSIMKWFQQKLSWQAHHWCIPNPSTPANAGSEVLRRYGQAGWNLFPLPAKWNNAIKNGGAGYNATRLVIGSSIVAAPVGGYELGSAIRNLLTGDEDE